MSIELNSGDFLAIQHRFRGLIADFRTRAFVKDREQPVHRKFRAGLRELLLDARAAIDPRHYRPMLEWIANQCTSQVGELQTIPIGYDELVGIYTKAPVVALERELLWITERLSLDAARLSKFVATTRLIQNAVFAGNNEAAIRGVGELQATFGISIWSAQLRLALEHLAGGLERQKRYSAELRNAHRRGLLSFISYHTSVRNEDRTTLVKFIDDIEIRIAGLTTHDDPLQIYDRYRLKNELPATDLGLANVLRIEQSHGIFDLYETYITVLQELARQPLSPERVEFIVRCLNRLNILDFRINKLLDFLLPTTHARLPSRPTDLSDALFGGAVRRALSLTRGLHTDDPWRIIYASFAISHLKQPHALLAARPKAVPALLACIHGRHAGCDDAWAQLTKLMLNLRGLPLAAGLFECLVQLRRTKADEPWRPWLIGLNSPHNGIEDRAWRLGCSVAIDSRDPTQAAWYEASCPGDFDGLAHRTIRAVGHVFRSNYELVNATLSDNANDWPAPLRNLAALVQLHALHALGERRRVIELIANEGTRGPTHRRFLPIADALRSFLWQDFKEVRHPLASPVALHLLWLSEESSETASKLRFATGHVLRRAGISRPSDLEVGTLDVQLHELIYFLRYVCVPDILDLSRLFPGTRELLEERQAICGTLARIDPDNSEHYQGEIVHIANELALDEGRWIVDRTRIHVDSDGLDRWAQRELAEDYLRYRDLVDIDITTPQTFDDVLKELQNVPAQRGTFVPTNEADAVLVSILLRLGDEFLTNANFGLDFFLSKRVRHQSFIGLIRGPLEFASLITTRESEIGDYHRNDAWLSRFERIDEMARSDIDAALRKFSLQFDEILINAKETYLHLRSASKPQGMIALTLDERLVNIARAIIRLNMTFAEFIPVAVQILWLALEPSMLAIRTFIKEDMKSRVTNEFDAVRARVRKLAEMDPTWLDFDNVIGGAANEVQLKLDEAASWFVHADTLRRKRPFSLEQILAIGVDTALKTQRGFTPKIFQSSEGDISLYAPSLVFIHDVLFVGLGNARKHSGLKEPSIDVMAKWNETEDTVTLSVESDCRPSNRAEKERQAAAIRKVIAEGAYDRRTRTEGGSGFAKLAAVVLQSERGDIKFEFTLNGRFRLDVTYAVVQFNQSAADAA